MFTKLQKAKGDDILKLFKSVRFSADTTKLFLTGI